MVAVLYTPILNCDIDICFDLLFIFTAGSTNYHIPKRKFHSLTIYLTHSFDIMFDQLLTKLQYTTFLFIANIKFFCGQPYLQSPRPHPHPHPNFPS